MKRDMDLIRKIALEVEDMTPGRVHIGIDGIGADEYGIHALWMREAGLIHADIQEFINAGQAPKVRIRRLTWEGCEFVEAIRNDTLWQKAKDNVMKPSMSFTFDVLKQWLKTEITQGLPTIRTLGQ